jgi:hypothetical protein
VQFPDLNMDFVFEFLNEIAGGDSTLVVSAFVFLSAAALAFGIMAIVQVRVAVKRRAAGIGTAEKSTATTTRARCGTPARWQHSACSITPASTIRAKTPAR